MKNYCRKIFGLSKYLVGVLLFGSTLYALPGYSQDEYWHQRVSLFDRLPVTESDIVFLGNSITDGGEFQELFGFENILNRGIRSDRISGVMKRIDQVTTGRPKAIFLLIGINDVADSNNTVDMIANKYEALVRTIREKAPSTKLYVQSIMPINNDFKRYRSLRGREVIIPPLNERLQQIALHNGAVYVDLWPILSDVSTGKLHKDFTNDGLHLTGPGYKAWAEALFPFIEDLQTPPGMLPEVEEEPQPISIIRPHL